MTQRENGWKNWCRKNSIFSLDIVLGFWKIFCYSFLRPFTASSGNRERFVVWMNKIKTNFFEFAFLFCVLCLNSNFFHCFTLFACHLNDRISPTVSHSIAIIIIIFIIWKDFFFLVKIKLKPSSESIGRQNRGAALTTNCQRNKIHGYFGSSKFVKENYCLNKERSH